MAPNYTWHDLDEAGGVLEPHERLTEPAPALELERLLRSQYGSVARSCDRMIRLQEASSFVYDEP